MKKRKGRDRTQAPRQRVVTGPYQQQFQMERRPLSTPTRCCKLSPSTRRRPPPNITGNPPPPAPSGSADRFQTRQRPLLPNTTASQGYQWRISEPVPDTTAPSPSKYHCIAKVSVEDLRTDSRHDSAHSL